MSSLRMFPTGAIQYSSAIGRVARTTGLDNAITFKPAQRRQPVPYHDVAF